MAQTIKIIIYLIIVNGLAVNFCLAAEPIDSDNDGLNDNLEISLRTNSINPDTDGDGFKDGDEVFAGYSPLMAGDDKSLRRKIVVDLTRQKLNFYFNDVKLGEIPVSTGLITMPTPTGEFSIIKKVPLVWYRGANYNYPNTKWNLMFKPRFYIHGAFWHNQFGIRPMSHGCVNVSYKDMEKLYKFIRAGDEVEIIGRTPRGKVK